MCDDPPVLNEQRAYPPRRLPIRQGIKIIFELTNLCNFSCIHCLRSEEGEKRFIDPELIDKVLREAELYRQVSNVSLTGGEPTVHPRFAEIVDLVARHGYPFSFVTNGWGFRRTFDAIAPVKGYVRAVSFSLDGATEEVHDYIRRRKGSFRQVMGAIALCRHHEVPVQINMTITRDNRHQLDEMALLASRLGCDALAYAHCQPTDDAVRANLVMDADERLGVESDVAELQGIFKMKVYLAGDHAVDSPFFQCSQLQMREFNVDYRGYLTACCTLSNYRGGAPDTDVLADLNEVSLQEAHRAMISTFADLNREKVARLGSTPETPADRFMCSHCLLHYQKVPQLEEILAPRAAEPAEGGGR